MKGGREQHTDPYRDRMVVLVEIVLNESMTEMRNERRNKH